MSKGNRVDDAGLVVVDQVLPIKLPTVVLHTRPLFPEMISPMLISDKHSIDTIDYALEHGGYIGFVLIRDTEREPEYKGNLYSVGVVARVLKRINLPDGGINIFVNAIKRFQLRKLLVNERGILLAAASYEPEDERDDDEVKALTRALFALVREVTENNPLFSEEARLTLVNVQRPARLADFIASILNITREEQQAVLAEYSLKARLTMVLKYLTHEKDLLALQQKIQEQINEKLGRQQREFFLKEQLKAIRAELGMEVDEKSGDVARFREALEKLRSAALPSPAAEGGAGPGAEVEEKLAAEIDKLEATDPHSPEYTVIRTYLETVFSLPWNTVSADRIEITRASRILSAEHFGLDEVKDRILEFLAVQALRKTSRGSILCLVGPPGVGKTSLGKAIAASMNRKFFRFSLGGMRDEAEIKGHRRTYIGAMPGKIIEALKITKTANPVLMLDEIDKLGQSYQGDPSSALLEVLDPEQNNSFRDHYLDIPFDLSRVFFITTANTLDSIPAPLLDRMEVMQLSGYISEDKAQIAARYLIPRALEANGLPKGHVSIPKPVLLEIANGYAREAGVRNLEKQINRIMRRAAYAYVADSKTEPVTISAENLKDYLGEPSFREEKARSLDRPGLALGLAWTSMGGDVLTIECLALPGKAGLKLTGKLGEVMTESAALAWAYSKNLAIACGIPEDWFEKHQMHVHVPAGATPKDGPSAGITMASAMLSLVLGQKLRNNLAMTGELSLVGDVLPIGGLKEKVIAAKRSGIREVIIPFQNEAQLAEIPKHVRRGITFYLARTMADVKEIVFTKGSPPQLEALAWKGGDGAEK